MRQQQHGWITAVKYQDGVVLCDVQPFRVNTQFEDVPVLKQFSGFHLMPTVGQKVKLIELGEQTRFITDVITTEEESARPASMQEGEVVFQFDADTKLTFTKDGAGNYNVDISASGDVNVSALGSIFIDGIDFTAHTHTYTDSTDTTSTTRTTDPPQ